MNHSVAPDARVHGRVAQTTVRSVRCDVRSDTQTAFFRSIRCVGAVDAVFCGSDECGPELADGLGRDGFPGAPFLLEPAALYPTSPGFVPQRATSPFSECIDL